MVCDRTAKFVVRRIRRDAGNGPDEPRQLTRNRGDHDLLQLALRYHVTISVAQPELRFPSNRAHRFRHNLYGCQFVAGYAGREAVTVGGFDQQGTLRRGTAEEIAREAREAIAETGGRGLLLAPGCSVPPMARKANLKAMMEAVAA